MTSEEKFTADKIRTLLGKPRLMPGESEEAYQTLFEAFVAEHQPDTLAEWLDVDQLTLKQWEQQRLRRCNTALIESTMPQALQSLLRKVIAVSVHTPEDMPALNSIDNSPAKLSREYYFGIDKKRKLATEKVRAWGITEEHILAEAIQMRAAESICFDRMDNYRANSKRALRKNLQSRPGAPDKASEISIN